MWGPARPIVQRIIRPRCDRSGPRRGHRSDAGAIAAEFALLTTLVAGITFGTAAVVGTSVDEPLQALTSVLDGLTVGAG